MRFAAVLLYTLLFATVSVFSQLNTGDTAFTYAKTITRDDLKKHLTVVASAEMEGRETGTAGQRRAAAYIQSQFENFGLKAPDNLKEYQQFYPVKTDSLVPKSLKLGKMKLTYGKDYTLFAGSSEEDEFKAKEIIYAGYGIKDSGYDSYKGKDVTGKLVMVLKGEPRVDGQYMFTNTARPSSWTSNLTRKARLARKMGAVALLVMDTSVVDLSTAALKSRPYLGKPDDSSHAMVPVIQIDADVFGKLWPGNFKDSIMATARSQDVDAIAFQKKIKAKLVYKKRTVTTLASNVIGIIEGTDKKEEYLFLTAHYDHLGKKGGLIYYGADDDGSGTVSVIEIAEAFALAKAGGYGPRRTIVFMTVSGEEKGLWGSEYFTDNPIVPLKNVTADLNTDMVGRMDPSRTKGDSTNYVYVIGNDMISSDLKNIHRLVNEKYIGLELDYRYNDPKDPERIFFRSDHYNFAKYGVPILFFFDGIHKDYHRPTDTVDKINFDLMEKRVRYIFLIAWDMANRESMLKRDRSVPAMSR